MPVRKKTQKQEYLIDGLESVCMLDDRYENLRCVSFSQNGERRGNLSLVFKATDTLENRTVAIKMVDPEMFGKQERLQAFQDEPKMLSKVDGNKRCVQLLDSNRTYTWDIDTAAGLMPFDCEYFVTDWIEDDIDTYVYRQDNFDAFTKLKIFKGVLLAVAAVHSRGLFHRDVKVDNIRIKSIGTDQIVVLIDFGCAGYRNAAPKANLRDSPVGAPGYAPPEAWLGFSEDASIAHLSDNYALGVMLFDLFN